MGSERHLPYALRKLPPSERRALADEALSSGTTLTDRDKLILQARAWAERAGK